MLRRIESLLELGEHLPHVAFKQRFAVEPEAGEDARAPDVVGIARHGLVLAAHEAMPADLSLVEEDGQVLRNLRVFKEVEFLVEVVGRAAQTNLSKKLRRAV